MRGRAFARGSVRPVHRVSVAQDRRHGCGMTQGPVAALAERRKSGDMRPDAAQDEAARRMQRLYDELSTYRPGGSTGWRAKLGLDRPKQEPPRGIYMFGPVGVGKSMLMDLFFVTAPVARKRRVHFHEFLQEVHERAHRPSEWLGARSAR